MRKHQQKQILELLRTISQAQSARLYADCQEGALSLCDFIEDIEGAEGAGADTIALLIEYCELLFKVNSGDAGEKTLRKQMIKIENSVNHDLKPGKIEIVFISYKASMGDSLESIYRCAEADSDFNAVWLPVPYFDRNPDGSLGSMHYEGAESYCSDINSYDWQKYDLSKIRPDVIFFNNPYDELNNVTSVHPDFYSKNLCQYTDLLVYVPYFVGYGVARHMCTTAGCVYAQKIIVQSEDVRDTYISEYSKTYGTKFGNPKTKFIALGSPKYDTVINATKEAYPLPDEWKNRIGENKVILYNSSLAAMLNDNGMYFDKLRDSFSFFSKQKDITLWWRPHPLAQATYSSMLPARAAEYDSIISEFMAKKTGIYDDTPLMHRALAWSDAYYGDGSSLYALYMVTGKPMLYQIMDYRYEAENKSKKIPIHEKKEESQAPYDPFIMESDEYSAYQLLHDLRSEHRHEQKLSDNALASMDGKAGERILLYVKKEIMNS